MELLPACPSRCFLQFKCQVPDFVLIVGGTVVFLFPVTAKQYHTDILVAGDTTDSSEGFGQMLASLNKAREFDFDDFHIWVSFLLAVAVFFGDEVIEPAGNLVAGEGVEGLQFVPGGLEVVFAGVFEYDIEVAASVANISASSASFSRLPLFCQRVIWFSNLIKSFVNLG